MSKIDESCPYCETKFSIEFDNEDDELMFCPSCGEELPEFEADEPIDMYHDEEWNQQTIMDILTPHGKTLDTCEAVVERYKNNPQYKDNKTVQEWVRQSELVIITNKVSIP